MLLGLGTSSTDPWAYAALAKLPRGTYSLQTYGSGANAAAITSVSIPAAAAAERAAVGFLLGHHSFERYKSSVKSAAGQTTAAATVTATGADSMSGVDGVVSSGEVGTEVLDHRARLVWPEGCDRCAGGPGGRRLRISSQKDCADC